LTTPPTHSSALAAIAPPHQNKPETTGSADSGGETAPGRIAVFVAPVRVSQAGTAWNQDVTADLGPINPTRVISWLLSADEHRFLPVIAGPLVALMVVGRALTSAGSGTVAPIALVATILITGRLDRRNRARTAAIT
jgi:hypothetical protein